MDRFKKKSDQKNELNQEKIDDISNNIDKLKVYFENALSNLQTIFKEERENQSKFFNERLLSIKSNIDGLSEEISNLNKIQIETSNNISTKSKDLKILLKFPFQN